MIDFGTAFVEFVALVHITSRQLEITTLFLFCSAAFDSWEVLFLIAFAMTQKALAALGDFVTRTFGLVFF